MKPESIIDIARRTGMHIVQWKKDGKFQQALELPHLADKRLCELEADAGVEYCGVVDQYELARL